MAYSSTSFTTTRPVESVGGPSHTVQAPTSTLTRQKHPKNNSFKTSQVSSGTTPEELAQSSLNEAPLDGTFAATFASFILDEQDSHSEIVYSPTDVLYGVGAQFDTSQGGSSIGLSDATKGLDHTA
ncbi:hypothetical protein SUNI508_11731 [Seiridium unicorne]|uniref:Uncharacterized protein n=1 Tax=Seiridium unicorne TaxID=138068 RepID=A0ABR2UGB0_9PEZI